MPPMGSRGRLSSPKLLKNVKRPVDCLVVYYAVQFLFVTIILQESRHDIEAAAFRCASGGSSADRQKKLALRIQRFG